MSTKKAIKTKDTYSVDLSKLGYSKLLSSGELTQKVSISVPNYSTKAKQKVESVGGKIE